MAIRMPATAAPESRGKRLKRRARERAAVVTLMRAFQDVPRPEVPPPGRRKPSDAKLAAYPPLQREGGGALTQITSSRIGNPADLVGGSALAEIAFDPNRHGVQIKCAIRSASRRQGRFAHQTGLALRTRFDAINL